MIWSTVKKTTVVRFGSDFWVSPWAFFSGTWPWNSLSYRSFILESVSVETILPIYKLRLRLIKLIKFHIAWFIHISSSKGFLLGYSFESRIKDDVWWFCNAFEDSEKMLESNWYLSHLQMSIFVNLDKTSKSHFLLQKSKSRIPQSKFLVLFLLLL